MTTENTIFACRTGSELTAVEYYKVTKKTDKSVWLAPLKSKTVKKNGFAFAVPTDEVAGKEIRKQLFTYRGDTFAIIADCYARPWNGSQPRVYDNKGKRIA